MTLLKILLIIILIALQVRIFSAEGGIAELFFMENRVNEIKVNLTQQTKMNEELFQKVQNLKTEASAVEEIARKTLGMIKEDEQLFMVIEKENPSSD
jgi:cell division protein FtsB